MKGKHWFRLTTAEAAALREAANVRRDPGLPREPITKAHERTLNAAWDTLNHDPAADADRVVVVLTVRQAEALSHAAGNTTSDPESLLAVFSDKRRALNCLAAHTKLDDAIRSAGGFGIAEEHRSERTASRAFRAYAREAERFRTCAHSYCTEPARPGVDTCAGHDPALFASQHLASCVLVGGAWLCAADCPNHVIVDAEAKR
jgi:hypothetical protein